MVVATVDRLASTAEVAEAGVVIPAHSVAAVTEVPFGAHPSSCYPGYAYDRPHLATYVAAATKGGAELEGYLDRFVRPGEDLYAKEIDAERLTSWSESTDSWKELFR
jgi:glutaconate CoA-transferase subunit A